MIDKFAGMEISAQFKNPQVVMSKCDEQLKPQQMCYAAFDVAGLYQCLPVINKTISIKNVFMKHVNHPAFCKYFIYNSLGLSIKSSSIKTNIFKIRLDSHHQVFTFHHSIWKTCYHFIDALF